MGIYLQKIYKYQKLKILDNFHINEKWTGFQLKYKPNIYVNYNSVDLHCLNINYEY